MPLEIVHHATLRKHAGLLLLAREVRAVNTNAATKYRERGISNDGEARWRGVAGNELREMIDYISSPRRVFHPRPAASQPRRVLLGGLVVLLFSMLFNFRFRNRLHLDAALLDTLSWLFLREKSSLQESTCRRCIGKSVTSLFLQKGNIFPSQFYDRKIYTCVYIFMDL